MSLVAAQAASARTADDPCGSNPHRHVAGGGLHCGAIFTVPGHRTWYTPGFNSGCLDPRCNTGDAPPICPSGQGIRHFGSPAIGEWDYWTKEGKWVVWDGGAHESYYFTGPNDTQKVLDGLWPRFHNWWHEGWEVRVYFYCKTV